MSDPTPTSGSIQRAGLVWHRRDLRIDDNSAIAACLDAGLVPHGIFVFDSGILDPLPKRDRRVEFIHGSIAELSQSYAKLGLSFEVVHGDPEALIPQYARSVGAQTVFAGRDYEVAAKERDAAVMDGLSLSGIALALVKDHVCFESHEILTLAKTTFAVFTPYKNTWLKQFDQDPPRLDKTAARIKTLGRMARSPGPMPTLAALGFEKTDLSSLSVEPGEKGARLATRRFTALLDDYEKQRDFPGLDATSRLGPHLRFGTVSVRRLALWAHASSGAGPRVWLSELIWREFYSCVADMRPTLAQGNCYQSKFDKLAWDNEPAKLDAWKNGMTGVPIVDAGMRELLATGHMHNRVRMVVASFLAKHLDCDWRSGESHFAQWLLDFDFASNNGGWQWSASTGCDAQPYFRIFNPYSQSERFDPDGSYIKKWAPELSAMPAKNIHNPSGAKPEVLAAANVVLGVDYPPAIVDHASARKAALAKYGAA